MPASHTHTHIPTHAQAYVGRLAAASPATGSSKVHEQEASKLIAEAFA